MAVRMRLPWLLCIVYTGARRDVYRDYTAVDRSPRRSPFHVRPPTGRRAGLADAAARAFVRKMIFGSRALAFLIPRDIYGVYARRPPFKTGSSPGRPATAAAVGPAANAAPDAVLIRAFVFGERRPRAFGSLYLNRSGRGEEFAKIRAHETIII